MKAEIISIVKDEDDVLLQVRCSPPSRAVESTPNTEILEKMRKTLFTYLEEEDERVKKRDKEIAEYKRQQSRFRLSYIEIGDIGE
jgi:hypothetical protein